jgi:hypothetical protein
MRQTSDHKTLVIHQIMKPDNNPEDFKQHYDHGGSLQLRIHYAFCPQTVFMRFFTDLRTNIYYFPMQH